VPSIILAATAIVADEVLALNTACNVRVREEPEHYRAEDSLRFLSRECIFWRGTVVGVAAVVHSRKTAEMVCEQTWCFVQRVYLHIHLQIGGFSLLVFEYLMYFLHGMTEVRFFCFFSVFFPKETGKTVWKLCYVDVGHFGHIVLPMPVYHPFHVAFTQQILSKICIICYRLTLKKKVHSYSFQLLFTSWF